MRIAICGAQCTGKTTLVNDFLAEWSMYKKSSTSITDTLRSKKMLKKHSENGNMKGQEAILNNLVDQAMLYGKDEKVIHDRCVIDNLAYTIWLYNYRKGGVNDNFVNKSIQLAHQALKFIDVIFFLPISASTPIHFNADKEGVRSTDVTYREEVDNILKAMVQTYHKQTGQFFPKDDCPAVIDLVGGRQERIEIMKLYINKDGEQYGDEQSLISLPPQFGEPTVDDFR